MPVTCSRCLYDIVMANEGKRRALRFIEVAGSVEGGRKAMKSAQCVRNRKMHQISEEMKEVKMLEGTFFDYAKSAEHGSIPEEGVMQSASRNENGYHTLYYTNKERKNMPIIVSIPKESSRASFSPAPEAPSVSI
jgi:hypothetical protein